MKIGVVCALLVGATSTAHAASKPVAARSQPAGAVDVLVPVPASVRSSPLAGWSAQMKGGGAKVTQSA